MDTRELPWTPAEDQSGSQQWKHHCVGNTDQYWHMLLFVQIWSHWIPALAHRLRVTSSPVETGLASLLLWPQTAAEMTFWDFCIQSLRRFGHLLSPKQCQVTVLPGGPGWTNEWPEVPRRGPGDGTPFGAFQLVELSVEYSHRRHQIPADAKCRRTGPAGPCLNTDPQNSEQ